MQYFKHTPHVVSTGDVELLWAALSIKYRLVAQLMFECALRFIDCQRLKRADVDFKNRVLWIRKQKNNHEDEPYPLSNSAIRILRSMLRCTTSEWLCTLPRKPGKQISVASWQQAIWAARKRAGVNGGVYMIDRRGYKRRRLSGHAMKAHRLQKAENAGLQLREIQALSHHRDWKCTMRYLSNPIDNFDLKLQALRKISEVSSVTN